jgi:hypothetical protein
LLVERKDDFFMAVVLSGKRAGNAAQRMLRCWTTSRRATPGAQRVGRRPGKGARDTSETKPMFSRATLCDRLKRKEGEDDSL